jgi:hypothetical protein
MKWECKRVQMMSIQMGVSVSVRCVGQVMHGSMIKGLILGLLEIILNRVISIECIIIMVGRRVRLIMIRCLECCGGWRNRLVRLRGGGVGGGGGDRGEGIEWDRLWICLWGLIGRIVIECLMIRPRLNRIRWKKRLIRMCLFSIIINVNKNIRHNRTFCLKASIKRNYNCISLRLLINKTILNRLIKKINWRHLKTLIIISLRLLKVNHLVCLVNNH